jgi:uncharacterized protein YodC (DUF2158 family)
VRLKSGGPKMTVAGYDLYGLGATEKTYLCRWFDEKNKPMERTFSEAELEDASGSDVAVRFVRPAGGA